MKSGMTLNYRRIHAILLCLEEKSVCLCLQFDLVFFFVFHVSHARLWRFWLRRGLCTFCLRLPIIRFFSFFPVASQMDYTKLGKYVTPPRSGLHRRWRAEVTGPSIPHHYVFACHTESTRQFFFIYLLTIWMRAILLHLALWILRCAISLLCPGQIGCSLRAAMFWFRLLVESLFFICFCLRTTMI